MQHPTNPVSDSKYVYTLFERLILTIFPLAWVLSTLRRFGQGSAPYTSLELAYVIGTVMIAALLIYNAYKPGRRVTPVGPQRLLLYMGIFLLVSGLLQLSWLGNRLRSSSDVWSFWFSTVLGLDCMATAFRELAMTAKPVWRLPFKNKRFTVEGEERAAGI